MKPKPPTSSSSGVIALQAGLADRHQQQQCGRSGEVFDGDVGAVAMIDLLVYPAEVIALKAAATD